MEIETIVIYAGITIFSFGLFIISILGLRKHRTIKILFVTLAFLMFFIRGVILSLSLINNLSKEIVSSSFFWLLDLIILALLLIATIKR